MLNTFDMEPKKSFSRIGFTGKYSVPESTKEFIENHLKVRICYKYREKTKDRCFCNKERIEHIDTSNKVEPWSYINNTSLRTCNTYGFINFQGYDFIPHGHYPKFIRFDCLENCDETCESVYKLITENEPWMIPVPKLIISINGGLKKMKFISNQHKKNFKQGLIDVMKKDQTWVIGSGFNVGIHKLVSDTIYEFRLHHEDIKDQVSLIGICSWGVVRNNHKLQISERTDIKKTLTQRFVYENVLSNLKGKVTLDALYDHFLFCDDGTEKQYDREVEFRLKFEKYVKTKADGFLVQILFEGGRRAIETAFSALKNKVPLVVIKGSGRVANIISEVMELPVKNLRDNISYIIKENMAVIQIPESEIDGFVTCLFEMYTNYKKQIVIYDMMDTNIKFDRKILEAMILGADKSLEKTLKLCIRFNCPDIAEKLAFSDPKYGDVDTKYIQTMFTTALKDNKSEFVNLFVENNFEVEKFIEESVLRELYQVSFDPEKCLCAELLGDLTESTKSSSFMKRKTVDFEIDQLINVGNIIQKLSGNILTNRYEELLRPKDLDQSERKSSEESDSEDEEPTIPWNSQDLFLWALLSGRTNLSEIFWKISKDHIGSALMASSILRNMADLVLIRGDNNLQKKLIDASVKYQDLAVSIVTEAYNKSKSKTYTLIVRSLKRWSNLTCLQIASNGDMLEFLNHSACRSYTMKVWMGELSPFLSSWKIILTIPFSLLLMKLVIIPTFPQIKGSKDQTDKINTQNKYLSTEKETLQIATDTKKSNTSRISFINATTVFYRAPIVKFYIHLFSYIAFLMIFSYVNLVELKPIENIKNIKEVFVEIYVYIYVLTFTIEEFRQVIDQEITGFTYKLKSYFSGTWNKLDVLIITVFVISTIIRFTIPKHHFMLCRCLFAVTLSMFFLRSMQFYFVNKAIGPKVIMIRDMLRDILFFLSIFIIFVMAYGTLAQSLKFPNSDLDLTLIKDIVYLPYFQTYGELMLDTFEVSGPCNGTDCIIKSVTVVCSFAIFLLMSNVLLISLLIAMFGYTFNQIQVESEKLWCFIRLQLVQEFYEKPLFPPPFNILYYMLKLLSLPCKSRCPTILFQNENNLLLQQLKPEETFKLCGFEQFCMEAAMMEMGGQKIVKIDKPNSEMTTISDLIDKLNIKSDLSPPSNVTMESIASFQVRLGRRLENIEQQLETRKQIETPKGYSIV